MSIEKLSAHDLIEDFEDAVKIRHYDPCGDMQPPKFTIAELRKEIFRRMGIVSRPWWEQPESDNDEWLQRI